MDRFLEHTKRKRRLLYHHILQYVYQPSVEYAKALAEIFPGNNEVKVCFGHSGMTPADNSFMHHLYSLCRKYGILFFSEEVQQGFYRTGKCFSIENYNIVPDGIIIGKSAGAGLVLGAFIGRKSIMDSLLPMGHIFTLSGNHLACSDTPKKCCFSVRKRFGNGQIIFTYDGSPFDPFGENDDEFTAILMKNLDVPCEWKYQNNQNILQMSFKKRTQSSVPVMLAAVASAILLGIVSRWVPESLTLLQE